jgi:hypothetical protein
MNYCMEIMDLVGAVLPRWNEQMEIPLATGK